MRPEVPLSSNNHTKDFDEDEDENTFISELIISVCRRRFGKSLGTVTHKVFCNVQQVV